MSQEGFPQQEQPIEKEPSPEVVENSETLHAGNLLEVGKTWKALLLNEGEPAVPTTKAEAEFYIEKLGELTSIAKKEFAPGEKEAYEERLDAYIEKLKEVK